MILFDLQRLLQCLVGRQWIFMWIIVIWLLPCSTFSFFFCGPLPPLNSKYYFKCWHGSYLMISSLISFDSSKIYLFLGWISGQDKCSCSSMEFFQTGLTKTEVMYRNLTLFLRGLCSYSEGTYHLPILAGRLGVYATLKFGIKPRRLPRRQPVGILNLFHSFVLQFHLLKFWLTM